jgi:hypothetical protein
MALFENSSYFVEHLHINLMVIEAVPKLQFLEQLPLKTAVL